MAVALDHADVADTFALQAPADGLAAHAGADDQDIQHAAAVRAGLFRHPVGRRIVQPRQVVARDRLQFVQARRLPLDNDVHAVLPTLHAIH